MLGHRLPHSWKAASEKWVDLQLISQISGQGGKILRAQSFAMRVVVLQVLVVGLYRKGKSQVRKSVLVRATHTGVGG